MKIKTLLVAFGLLLMQVAFGAGGHLIEATANTRANTITFTTTTNMAYPSAGYRVLNADGVAFIHPNTLGNGFYHAPIARNQPLLLPYQGISIDKNPSIEVCLNVNGPKPLNCEQFTLHLTPGVNSFIIVGSSQPANTSSSLLRHSKLESYLFETATKLPYAFYTSDTLGDTWNPSTVPQTAASLEGVSCGSSGVICNATGLAYDGSNNTVNAYAAVSVNSGATWSSITLPSQATSNDVARYSAIACSSDGTTCHSLANIYSKAFADTTPIDFYYEDAAWVANTSFTLLANGTSYIARGMHCAADDGDVCLAVGTYIDTQQNSETKTSFPLILSLENGTWTASTFSLPSSATQVFLNNVACNFNSSSLSTCIAVGSLTTGSPASNVPVVFYSTDGGSSWTQSSTPALPTDANFGELNDIWCNKDASTCMAVGSYQTGSDTVANVGMPLVYQSTNSGTSWQQTTVQPSLDESDVGNGALTGVFCDDNTAQTCTVVGVSGDGAKSPLSYTTNDFGASTWTLSSPSKASGIQAGLVGVSCDRATGEACTTVGGSLASPVLSMGLFKALNPTLIPTIVSSTDSGVSATALIDNSTVRGVLFDAVFVSPSTAYAVGSGYSSDNISTNPLIKKISGTTVTTTELDVAGVSQLLGICEVASTRRLVTVGTSSETAQRNTQIAFTSTDSGASWQQMTLPSVPANTSSSALRTINSQRSSCYAFGDYKVGTHFPYALQYIASNNTWQVLTPPQPVQTSAGPRNTLLEHSANFDSGILLSAMTNVNNISQPAFYTLNTSTNIFSPPKLMTLPSGVQSVQISQVYCRGGTNPCYAVGSKVVSGGKSEPLMLSINTRTLALQEIAMPAVEGANGGVVLDTISCNLPGNTTCVIIGHEIVLGMERPVSFVSFNGGASYKQNKNFVLSRITSTSFAHSAPRPS